MSILFLLLHGYGNAIGQEMTPVINELMPENESILQDEDGAYSDWLEIYNPGEEAVSLYRWSLTDDPERLGKWFFPDTVVPAGGYLLLFASGKDRSVSGLELHTNFQLDADGEFLGLYDSEGNAVSLLSPEFPPVKTDYSLGYIFDDYSMFRISTPGSMNNISGSILKSPVFSVSHGYYYEGFELELSTDRVGATIYYTTDGTTPGLSNGTQYTSPIRIESTSIIRAFVYKGNIFPSEVITQTYIFPGQVVNQPAQPEGFPSEWGPWSQSAGRAYADYEMDPELMADPGFRQQAIEGLESIPVLSLVSDPDHFWSMSTDPETGGIYMYPAPGENDTGRGWERPVSAEYFDAEGTESFQVNCGIQINGGESRRPEKNPKHSFRLRFRGIYGPVKLNYDLFGDKHSAHRFDALVLRGGFNNSWTHWASDQRNRSQYIHDIWAKDTQREMGHVSGNSTFVHLFLNGVYWGIYALSERMDEEFMATYLPGEPEDFDVIKDYSEVFAGSGAVWNTLMDLARSGFQETGPYMTAQGKLPDGSPNPDGEALVDVVNLADYMLLNQYAGNTDWDHHNWVAARNRVDPGSGFKFFTWDAEHILESMDHNMIGEFNSNCPSEIFQSLRQNEAFRRLFADRVQRYCFNGGLLSPAAVKERWTFRKVQVEAAIVDESARWGDYRRDVHPYQSGPYELYTYDTHWLAEDQFLMNAYFQSRTDVLVGQLRAAGLYPVLDAPNLLVNGFPVSSGNVDRGDELKMTSTEGTIYFTLNGTDPAVWSDMGEAGETVLIPFDAVKKALIPAADIGDWKNPLFDDSGWIVSEGAPGGVGYEKGTGYGELISLDVGEFMHDEGGDPNTSCYIRIPFTVDAEVLEQTGSLFLHIFYDDGFTAYLNGTLVEAQNAPAAPTWNSSATGQHEASATPVVFDITPHRSSLSEGVNLLCLQGLNINTSSSDFIIHVSLVAMENVEVKIAEDARIFAGPLVLEHSEHIMARTWSGNSWSALTEKYLLVPEDYDDLKVTEIHYHPESMDSIDGDFFEFIELKNTGAGTLDLGDVSISEGIRYTFPTETQLLPGNFMVLASDPDWFSERYGFDAFDRYAGQLNNSGESLVLLAPAGDTLCSIAYEDDPPWPAYADGSGLSIVPIEANPAGDLSTPDQWQESYYRGGSPGADDYYGVDTTGITEKGAVLQEGFDLGQNYPNPVSEGTYFNYSLPVNGQVDLSVYTMTGRLICTLQKGYMVQGKHTVYWDTRDDNGYRVAAGVYFYRLHVENESGAGQLSGKLVIIR